MSLLTNNTLVATDIFFEDATTAVPEIEGVVVGTGSLPAQFSMVVLQETPAGIRPRGRERGDRGAQCGRRSVSTTSSGP